MIAIFVNTLACIVWASHGWWVRKSGFQQYTDLLTQSKQKRDKRAQALADKAGLKLFNVVCKIYVQSVLFANTLAAVMMANVYDGLGFQALVMISMYVACFLIASDFVPLGPKNCDHIALWGHVLLLLVVLCPSSDMEFVIMGGARSLLRVFSGILFRDLWKVLSANMVLSLASIWQITRAAQAMDGPGHCFAAICSETLCVVQVALVVLLVQSLVGELTDSRLHIMNITAKSHARRNLLSVLVDADITLDANLKICAPSNKAQHFFTQDLAKDVTSVEGMKFHHLVAEADRSKLREFLNRGGMNSTGETVDGWSESSRSIQGGGSPASSMSIQMGKSGRFLQLFHASIPVMDREEKRQPRHLVGIQEHFSAQEVRDTVEPDVFFDHNPDAEQVYLSAPNLAAQQQGFQGPARRPPSTGSHASRDSKRSASSASSLRSSVAGLPEVGSISFIFNAYSEGLSIVEATLRFDTFKDHEPRVPEMRHWIRSRHWDQFRNWVQTEAQRCCLGQTDQGNCFEGPLEFYYPGQPDMTLVAGSVAVMGIQQNGESEDGNEEEEEEEGDDDEIGKDPEEALRIHGGLLKQSRQDTMDTTQNPGGEHSASSGSMGCNASPPMTGKGSQEDSKEDEVAENPFFDQDAEAEVDALLVEVECKAFSQYRSLNSKPRKSKRYGHLCRNRPHEPSLDAIPERPFRD